MSRLDADVPQAMHNVPPLTDKQRKLVREFFQANPDGGYKSALAYAGIRATRPAAKAAFEEQDDLAEMREEFLGIKEPTLVKRLASIAANTEHKDCYNANRYLLAVEHGKSEKQALEVTGASSGPLQIIVESAFPTGKEPDDDHPGSVHGEPQAG